MRSTEDKIREVQQKHREQMKANRDKVKARKARTHRLIIRGAIAEQAIEGAETMTDQEFQHEIYKRIGQYTKSLQENPTADKTTPCEDPR